jgi:hypothetical protein
MGGSCHAGSGIWLWVDGLLKKPWAFRPVGAIKFDAPVKPQ